MAPTQIQIAMGSLERLLKEEKSYYKELDQQQARIARLEKGEGDVDEDNKDFQLKQEVRELTHQRPCRTCMRLQYRRQEGIVTGPMLTSVQKRAVEETKAVFPSLRDRIVNAREKLESYLVRIDQSALNGYTKGV